MRLQRLATFVVFIGVQMRSFNMDQIIYDNNGNFQCVCRDGATFISPGTPLWNDYVSQNGTPPATGTPTFPQQPLPTAVQNAVAQAKAFQNNSTPTMADAVATIKAQTVILKYFYQQLLS